MKHLKLKIAMIIIIVLILIASITVPTVLLINRPGNLPENSLETGKIPNPSTPGTNPTPEPGKPEPGFFADIYVSTLGNNLNDGLDDSHPVLTVERAVQIALSENFTATHKTSKITIALFGGAYSPVSLTNVSSAKPIEIIPYSDQRVVFTQNKTLNADDFTPVTGEDKNSLLTPNKQNVYCVDLARLSLTATDVGTMYGVGKYLAENNYLPANVNKIKQAQFYIDGKKQNFARYPNGNNMLSTGTIYNAGKLVTGKASPGGVFALDTATASRVNGWKTLDDVWLYGYFGNDWADSSTKISDYNFAENKLTTTYAHNYSYKINHKYNFYNVFEELDEDGEFYIDRANLKLYLYTSTPLTGKNLQLAIGNVVLFKIQNSKNITIRGMEFSGTRKNALELTSCQNVSIAGCTIKEIAENALNLTGTNNTIKNNTITAIGALGINLKNTINRNNLTPDNNLITGNNINNFGQITRTYAPAINLDGVGNTASGNILHTAPHTAIMFAGNNNIIERNEIFDVCQFSGDCGAIYSGRSFSYYGNVLRYNYLHNIGANGFKPNGIYLDDYLSGQTVHSNVLANISGNGILVGGGRDNNITNNIFLNAKLSYDQRAYEYYKQEKVDYTNTATGSFWKLIQTAKRLNTSWGNQFSAITAITSDTANSGIASFGVNPGGSTISNNYFLRPVPTTNYMSVRAKVWEFSTVKGNVNEDNTNNLFDLKRTYDKEYVYSFLNYIFATHTNITAFEMF